VTARLGIVLVNWNRWADTIECLESVLRSSVPVRVVVIDNASADGSPERIAAWAAGSQPITPTDAAMARLSTPALGKPIDLVRLAAGQMHSDPAPALTLIDGGGNLGFAGGNNLGIVHLLADPAITHVWLLNNDTVIEPGAAAAILDAFDADAAVGMCGTVVHFYHEPDTLQCLNGSRFNKYTANSTGIAMGTRADAPFDHGDVIAQTDFVLGASMAVSRAFVETVGSMEDGYFLYFEEIDWAYRNAGRFRTGFAAGATVYHKEGGSIGSSSVRGGRSAMSEYWLMRAKLMFVRRFLPGLLPLHLALAAAQIARRIWRRQPGKARVMLQALFNQPFRP